MLTQASPISTRSHPPALVPLSVGIPLSLGCPQATAARAPTRQAAPWAATPSPSAAGRPNRRGGVPKTRQRMRSTTRVPSPRIDTAPEQLLRDVPLERVQKCPPVLLHAWEGLGRDVATCRPANRHGALCAVCSHRSASAKKGRSVPRESSEKPIGRGNVRWSTRVAYEGCYRNEGRWGVARGRHSSLVRGTAGYCGVLRGTAGVLRVLRGY